jgi:hypothetical protein
LGVVQYVTNSQKQALKWDRFYGTTLKLQTGSGQEWLRRTSPSSNPNPVTEQLAAKGQTDSFPICNYGFSNSVSGLQEVKLLLLDSCKQWQLIMWELALRSVQKKITQSHVRVQEHHDDQ